ncbi:hypothetical protein ACFE6N_16145 [Pedobacter sp. BG31]|uniref:hypothetical protein n=1 Tax=Pedobacter sp. BG31 TaxID=3349697 RepID=UPI0035F3FBF4
MANYSFTFKNPNPVELWKQFQYGLNSDVIVKSINEKIHYTVQEINDNYISFSAPSRNKGEIELISQEDFVKTVSKLSAFKTFNTSNAKKAFKGGGLYRKRSPLFAILKSAKIIKEVALK